MTPKQIKQQIALLKKEGINKLINNVLLMYVNEIQPLDLQQSSIAEITMSISLKLLSRYKSQLPKKVVKVKQKTLQEEIDQVYKERGNIKERFNDIDNGRN